jgi:hypothetical protein
MDKRNRTPRLYNPATEITTGQAAKIAEVATTTIIHWCDRGYIPHELRSTTPGATQRRVINRVWFIDALESGYIQGLVGYHKPKPPKVKPRKRPAQFPIRIAAELLDVSRYTVYLMQNRGELPKPLTHKAVLDLVERRKDLP